MSHGVDSDDSDDLPEFSKVISTPSSSLSTITKGDIVWAKFKNLYWPALVRSVHKKEKKISVWYTDDPGKTFKLPVKNVCSFHDSKMKMKIRSDVREAGCVQEHEGLTSHANTYLNRRAEGYVDDPMKFFDQTYPFFLMEELLRKNPDADVSNVKIPPMYISHEKNTRKNIKVQKATTSFAESEIESTNNDCESDAEDVTKDYLSEVKKEIVSATSKDKNVDEIIQFIKKGKADNYLKKILSKSVPSEHRNIYEKVMKQHDKHVAAITYTGPIENDEKIRELIFYLLPLYESMTKSTKEKRYPSRISPKSLNYPTYDKSDKANFVASVWLPESIIYSMSVIYKVSLSDAKKLFHKHTESETKEVEKIIASIGCGDTKHSSDSDKFLEINDEASDAHIPLKKICVDKITARKTAVERTRRNKNPV